MDREYRLYVTSGEIKKAIKKLDAYSSESRGELLDHIGEITGRRADYRDRVSKMIDYFYHKCQLTWTHQASYQR